MPVYCVSVVFLLSVDCRLPMKVGPCRAAFPRFFYNPTNQSCSSFVYGGCESNRNNFLTLEECESSCSGVTEHCEAELQVGPCRAAFRRWYYDREAGSCQSFTYGGCKGNKNNYVDEESCMVTCSGKYCTCHCLVSPDPGPCRAAFPMFYYNPDSASCQSFIYGGCRGNKKLDNTNRTKKQDKKTIGRSHETTKMRHKMTKARHKMLYCLLSISVTVSDLHLSSLQPSSSSSR
uniref:BPTI/Kunitz inhibitor domain-containing protein n=1 Tax=Amphiprion ocellaris TaxID=80972 RepID=A0A3Q1AGZ1_AMPOC